jgi:hypothetical protein
MPGSLNPPKFPEGEILQVRSWHGGAYLKREECMVATNVIMKTAQLKSD